MPYIDRRALRRLPIPPSSAPISSANTASISMRPLSLQQRAQAWAFERMIEHHVYWALVGARWVDADNFAKGPAHFFDGAPEHKRDKMREDAQFRVAENYLLERPRPPRAG